MRSDLDTMAELKDALAYDRETGLFTWKRTVNNNAAWAGSVAGTKMDRYVSIGFARKQYWAHRLAWFFVHGEWPVGEVDHINGLPSDNRIANLRVVNHQTNQQNRRKARSDSVTGIQGVRLQFGRYIARIGINGKSRHIGSFLTVDAASEAFLKAKRALHIGCTI